MKMSAGSIALGAWLGAAGMLAAASNSLAELKLGEAYEIQSGPAEISKRYVGRLILRNDDWLVLEFVRPGRVERGAPVAPGIPVANRIFHTVGIGRNATQYWIPTGRAQVVGQPQLAETPLRKAPMDLALGADVVAEWTEKGQAKVAPGKLVAVDPGYVSLEHTARVLVSRAVPGLGDLPLIGGWFRSEHSKVERTEHHIARADLLCIRVEDNFFEREPAELTAVPDLQRGPRVGRR